MKAIQVMFEEALLAELDKTAEVREQGRSAVLRQLTSDFLRRRRKREIDTQYERAYAGVEDPPPDVVTISPDRYATRGVAAAFPMG
jgi:predicted transcriptional regulator